MVHEELVQTMRWKQIRGKFYPQLLYLIKVNTPRAVMQETKKAFRKLPNLEQAITALSNLKGVGITMASGKKKNSCLFLLCLVFSKKYNLNVKKQEAVFFIIFGPYLFGFRFFKIETICFYLSIMHIHSVTFLFLQSFKKNLNIHDFS